MIYWLTEPERTKGKIAPGNRQQCPAYGTACRGIRVIWRKLEFLNPNLQKAQMDACRKDARSRCQSCGRIIWSLPQSSGSWAMPCPGIQGDKWGA